MMDALLLKYLALLSVGIILASVGLALLLSPLVSS